MFQDNQEAAAVARRVSLTPTNKTPTHPGRRRALGELTNTPLLATPPKLAATSPGPAQPDTVTPTHNLKLLTELASKMAGSGTSARQTLHFEDEREGVAKEPLYLPSSASQEAASPHRDHPYGVKRGVAGSLATTVVVTGEHGAVTSRADNGIPRN